TGNNQAASTVPAATARLTGDKCDGGKIFCSVHGVACRLHHLATSPSLSTTESPPEERPCWHDGTRVPGRDRGWARWSAFARACPVESESMMGRPATRLTLKEVFDAARSRIERMSPRDALAATKRGVLLIDIRSSGERERDGVVPGSLHI